MHNNKGRVAHNVLSSPRLMQGIIVSTSLHQLAESDIVRYHIRKVVSTTGIYTQIDSNIVRLS
jgi:hypothetical protein